MEIVGVPTNRRGCQTNLRQLVRAATHSRTACAIRPSYYDNMVFKGVATTHVKYGGVKVVVHALAKVPCDIHKVVHRVARNRAPIKPVANQQVASSIWTTQHTVILLGVGPSLDSAFIQLAPLSVRTLLPPSPNLD